jgi:hypothetical protein
MHTFKISFLFNELTFTATVQRVAGKPVHYLISIENPGILKIPDPFIITANEKDEMINYPIIMEYPDLGFRIASSLKAYCHDNKIPLLT